MEHYEKRFGLADIVKGYLTPEQLIEALKAQAFEGAKKKAHRLVGEILLDMDIMDANQIKKTVKHRFSRSYNRHSRIRIGL